MVTATVHITGPEGQELEYRLEASNVKMLKHKIHLLGFEDMFGENIISMRQWRSDNYLSPIRTGESKRKPRPPKPNG